MTKIERQIIGEESMVEFGQKFGVSCGGNGVIFLEGDLGAGKTTLSRGVLQAYGHKGAVKSPTYTLVEPYQLANCRLYHFDLYRLGDPEELEYMGVRDYFDNKSLCLVEWPARGSGYLPSADVGIKVTVEGRGRQIICSAFTPKGEQILARLQSAQGG